MSHPSTIVEESFYDHTEHGRVKVVSVDARRVAFELVDEDLPVPGMHTIPKAKYERVSDFKARVEPADVTVHADLAVLNAEGKQLQ